MTDTDDEQRRRREWLASSTALDPDVLAEMDAEELYADHYHRYREDVALMKSIGVSAYRFSIAWPRIFPEGTGQPNKKGVDFYNRLVDELLAAGIEPFATLYHWDLPQTLQDRYGGWQSKDTVNAFADYVGYAAEQLSDRVKHFFTINEFRSFVDGGYVVPAGGTVTISLHEDGGWCELKVADNGPGIAPEDLPHIFDRFFRSRTARRRLRHRPRRRRRTRRRARGHPHRRQPTRPGCHLHHTHTHTK